MIFSGKKFSLELGKKTYVMGILNVTDDSFFDGGKYNSPEKALEHAKRMLKEGADIIDIGAHSTRPNHRSLTADEELEIIKKYLPLIYNETEAVISVDTFYPSVARYALQNGASIINDVSGNFNEKMAQLVKEYNCGWIVTHTGGGDSSTIPEYKNDIITEVSDYFTDILNKCSCFGINKNQLCLDVGIGFGKTYEHNLELIKKLKEVKVNDVAMLMALSSKRVVKMSTEAENDDLVYGTIAGNVIAILGGADIIRVHNVKENVLSCKMADKVLRG